MFYGMTTPIPLEVRRRIVRAYETGRGTQVEIARMFGTTQQFVSKLIQQYRQTGSMEPGHGGGHPPVFSGQSLQALQNCVLRQPDLTLEEVRERMGVSCSLASVHNTLARLGLRYKKRRFTPANKRVRT